jgi:hypothetical protein
MSGLMRQHGGPRDGAGRALPKRVFSFLGWWLGFSALLGPLSVCPACGQAGCPGGAASAGVLGGLLAVLLAAPKWLWRRVYDLRRREKGRDPQ